MSPFCRIYLLFYFFLCSFSILASPQYVFQIEAPIANYVWNENDTSRYDHYLYEMSPVEILNHEVDHALRHDTNPIQQRIDGQTNDPNYDNQEEKRVIMGSEQETARKLGKLNTTEVTRNKGII